jgi:hypothetical protein
VTEEDPYLLARDDLFRQPEGNLVVLRHNRAEGLVEVLDFCMMEIEEEHDLLAIYVALFEAKGMKCELLDLAEGCAPRKLLLRRSVG